MSFEHIPGIGMVHFNTVQPARVVPSHEKHSWATKGKLQRSQRTSCTKCGCEKLCRVDFEIRYRLAGQQQWLQERPACTGKEV